MNKKINKINGKYSKIKRNEQKNNKNKRKIY